eukprot:350970-Chlamydomonas_euryale.AAC.3
MMRPEGTRSKKAMGAHSTACSRRACMRCAAASPAYANETARASVKPALSTVSTSRPRRNADADSVSARDKLTGPTAPASGKRNAGASSLALASPPRQAPLSQGCVAAAPLAEAAAVEAAFAGNTPAVGATARGRLAVVATAAAAPLAWPQRSGTSVDTHSEIHTSFALRVICTGAHQWLVVWPGFGHVPGLMEKGSQAQV